MKLSRLFNRISDLVVDVSRGYYSEEQGLVELEKIRVLAEEWNVEVTFDDSIVTSARKEYEDNGYSSSYDSDYSSSMC
jgi:hypothetical protein